MKRWELFAIQIFAVACSYLILSITFASAFQITIYTHDDQESTAELLEFSDSIQKSFQYPYLQNHQYIQITFSSKGPSYLIKKVYLFRCKNLNPVECIQTGIEPVISVSQAGSLVFDETYKWSDVSSNNVGNFLILAKLDVNGEDVWMGSWDKVTKTGIRQFYHENHDMDGLGVYLKPGVSGEDVENYIESYHSLPFDDINYSVFSTISGASVEKLYDLSGDDEEIDPSGTGIPDFNIWTFSDNIFDENLRTWDFVFGADGRTANPVVFYSTEEGGPLPVEPGPNLVIDNLSPQVVTCGSDEVIQTSMHVDNASDIGYFQSYYYEMDGVRGEAITCSIINPSQSIYSYECSVPVADFPACNAGQSTLKFYFNYEGGIQLSSPGFPITLNAPEPALIVNSVIPNPFDCGIDTKLTSRLQVINPMEVTPETYYTFDGSNFQDLECSSSGSIYTCEIPENEICPLLQENLELTFKFAYGDFEVLPLPTQLFVTFPPPSLGIDTVTPQTIEAGETTSVNVQLHVNYPDFISYDVNDFNYKYLNKGFQPAACSLDDSYTDIKYYECTVDLEIPSYEDGVETLTFRLDGYMDGEPVQKTANAFFEILPPPPEPSLRIISTSSPLVCIQDPSLTVNARVENIAGTPDAYYSVDNGQTYEQLTCSPSGNLYACDIPKDNLCDLMSNVLGLTLKFVYPENELISNRQNIYINLPEPHIQVFSVYPDTLPIGETTSVTVNLYVQYPEMVGENPVFLYSYSGRTNQMSCTKVSSTSNRDYYDCANTEFEVPADYSGSHIPVIFSVQGTTLSFPANIPVTSIEITLPWLEIVSTIPSRIETSPGNQTPASFYVTVHNALENNLEHQATVITGSWISSGTCTEAQIDYDFNCDVTINVPGTAASGPNPVTLTLRVSDSRTFDISDETSVYVIPEETQIEIQTLNPDKLYCQGHTQQNPQGVTITAIVSNVASFELVEEDMSFNGLTISHTARYCTSAGQSITCEIPTDKFLEKVNCGQGELAPGEGSHYYPLTLTFIIESGGELVTVYGSRDISIEARPLEQYIQIVDYDVVDGKLESPINCLGSQTIELGDTGYVRIMYADLLHTDATEDDITWSFRLDAHDEQGKLTKGMGVSPETEATICNLVDYQWVDSHRIEDYECSLYVNTGFFQRCADGGGEIILTATSGGKTAEERIDVDIIRDDSDYQIDMGIVTEPMEKIDCQIQGYGEGASCSIASNSRQNLTIRIYNRNEDVELSDLNFYAFDISLTGTKVNAGERSLGRCTEDSREANKYVCPFQIGPLINLPEEPEYEVDRKDPDQTFDPISLGKVNLTIYVKYASNLARTTISRLDGEIEIRPKKPDYMINSEKMLQGMQENFDKFEDVFKWVVGVLSFCVVCGAGNAIIDGISGAMPGNKCEDGCKPNEECDPVTKKCKPKDSPTVTTEAQQTSYCSSYKSSCAQCVSNYCTWCEERNCVSSDSACKGKFTSVLAGCSVIGAPQSPSDYQPETGSISFDDGNGGGGSTGQAFTVIASAISLFLFAALVLKMFEKGDEDVDVEEEKSEIMKYMERGLKWGIAACVLPRLVGEIGAWIAEGGSPAEKGFGKVASFGKGLGNACNIVLKILPMIMMFIQFYISYLRFEMCMEMVKVQLEGGAQAAAQAPEIYQTQAGVQAGVSMMTNMMSCFDQLMQAMNRLTWTSMFMSQQLGTLGSGRTTIKYMYGDVQKSNGDTLCGPKVLRVVAYNFCKGGAPEQSISIVGESRPGLTCHVYTPRQCRYTSSIMPAYGSGGYGGGYGGMYQQTGESISAQLPIGNCEDGTITVVVDGVKREEAFFNYKSECQ